MSVYVLTIAGITRTDKLQTFTIDDPANGVGGMRFETLSRDGTYVPGLDDEVLLTEDGTRIFGGHVNGVLEHGAGGFGLVPITSEVSALDFNALATRRYFGELIPAGTLKAALTQVLPYLPGVTLDAAQVDGPTLPELLYSAWLVRDVMDQLAMLSGTVWKVSHLKVLRAYVPGTIAAPFNVFVGVGGNSIGDVSVEPSRTKYANRVLVYGTGVFSIQQDPIADTNPRELAVQAPDITTQVAADALGESVLAASLPIGKVVRYETNGLGLAAGQTQGINIAARHINNTFILTEIQSRGQPLLPVRRTVTALEGLVYQGGWREEIKQWGGSGGGVTLSGASGSATTYTRFAYPMGGSKLESVRGTGTSWEFVGEQVNIDNVSRGTLSASVNLRLWARDAGVGVKARMYDVTDSVACAGESATITSTTPQFVTFTSTLTAGIHLYQLQVQPNTADRDVVAEGIYAI